MSHSVYSETTVLYTADPGATILQVAQEMSQLANQYNRQVNSTFRDVSLAVTPGKMEKDIVSYWLRVKEYHTALEQCGKAERRYLKEIEEFVIETCFSVAGVYAQKENMTPEEVGEKVMSLVEKHMRCVRLCLISRDRELEECNKRIKHRCDRLITKIKEEEK